MIGNAAKQGDAAADQIAAQFRIIEEAVAALQMDAPRINAPVFQAVDGGKEPLDLSLSVNLSLRAEVVGLIQMGIRPGNLDVGQLIIPCQSIQILRSFTQTMHAGIDRKMGCDRITRLTELAGLLVAGQSQ